MNKQTIKNFLAYWQGYGVLEWNLPLIEKKNTLISLLQIVNSAPFYFWSLSKNKFSHLTLAYDERLLVYELNQISFQSTAPISKAIEALKFCVETEHKGIFVIENLHSLLQPAVAAEQRELVYSVLIDSIENLSEHGDKCLVLLNTTEQELPKQLHAVIPSIQYQLPEYLEIKEFLASFSDVKPTEELYRVCSGLSLEEIRIGISLAASKRQQDLIDYLLNYKVEQLRKLGLTLLPHPEVGEIGGLQRIKQELKKVKAGFSPAARMANLPLPKGWLLAGPPGTGKSFSAKVCASILGFPLIGIGVDNAIAAGANGLKKLLAKVEAQAPIVLFIDEFDKFFMANAGSQTSEVKQILGVFLTWLQEKRSHVFTIATLNRLDALPPELLRRGRFDRNFYVGFPQNDERKQIIELHAARYDSRYQPNARSRSAASGCSPLSLSQWRDLLAATEKFTGAELLSLVEESAWNAFSETYGFDQEISEITKPLEIEFRHLLKQSGQIKPLYLVRTEDVLAIENRAIEIAEPASNPDNSIYVEQDINIWGQKAVVR